MVSRGLPEPDLSRIQAIDPTIVVQTYLATTTQGISLKMLQSRLRAIADPSSISNAVKSLKAEGAIPSGQKELVLTKAIQKSIERKFALKSDTTFPFIRDKWLPLLALGQDVENEKVRSRLANANVLKHAIVGVVYGLSKDDSLSAMAVRTEITWRVLQAAFGDQIVGDQHPKIESSNVVARMVIANLAGVAARTMNDAVGALAAKALGETETDPANLRAALMRHALKAAHTVGQPAEPGDFAIRVKTVAGQLKTPPFRGKVAIAQVYDEFGRSHRDAGSLANFKERLVNAAKARELNLGRLDMPEHMSRDLRERSVTKWGTDEVHFIVTEWI